jgi:triosephosphate isomerase
MTKKLIIANWKLNPLTLKEAQALALKIDRKSKHAAVICPPIAFLGQIDYPRVGAQDSFWQNKGAFTGQVSPAQLKDLGVKYCIVGHSERRAVGETDEQINAKVNALLEHKITPVLCVGFETTVEQDDLEVVDVLKGQLKKGLAGVNSEKVIVAYEPVWAISSGNPYATKKIATPDHAEKIALFIKKYKVAKVLYGGSANVMNAKEFLEQRNVDGLLVGGASLLAEDFNKIINQ